MQRRALSPASAGSILASWSKKVDVCPKHSRLENIWLIEQFQFRRDWQIGNRMDPFRELYCLSTPDTALHNHGADSPFREPLPAAGRNMPWRRWRSQWRRPQTPPAARWAVGCRTAEAKRARQVFRAHL